MPSLSAFLPPHLTARLARRERLPPAPRVDTLAAALLLSDVAGFTALTERLEAAGRVGAEEIGALIDRAFRPAIRALARHGGSIVSFGGDALFTIFSGPAAVRRSVMAARDVKSAIGRLGRLETSAGPVTLAISQAIHHGTIRGAHLDHQGRRLYVVLGAPLATLARLEIEARGGEISISRAARRRMAVEPAPRRAGAATLPLERRLAAAYLAPQLHDLLGRFPGAYRRATVLFVETRGRAIGPLNRFYGTLTEVLDARGGMLLKTDLSPSGTKWLCLFGIPIAREGDADRAARAALELMERRGARARLRAALHAGTLVNIEVGTRTRRSFDVMGDVVNTAARALSLGDWGEVVVTDAMRRQLSEVTTSARGTHRVKGKSRPLRLHALRAATAPRRDARLSVPMVGRDAELARIVRALRRARRGSGTVIGVRADAGLGKSRLKYEAAREARRLGLEVHEGRAASFGDLSYGAVASLVKDALGLTSTPVRKQILERVAAAATELGLSSIDRNHLAAILGVRHPGSAIDQLDAASARLNNALAVRSLARALCRKRPRMLVLEDMHWVDGASMEVVAALVRGAHEAPLLMLLLYRPGFEPPPEVQEILLQDLPPAAVVELLGAHLGGVDEKVGALVREKAGGNPFYVEEVVRHLLESGAIEPSTNGFDIAREIRPDDLPGGVETLIAARLDRLSSRARAVAQHASVIGRSFHLELLQRLAGNGPEVVAGVAELEARSLIFQKAATPRVEFIWKHALTRDVAYAGMLASNRRKIHRSVADAIAAVFDRERERFHGVLGHHRELAGQRREARDCYLLGARTAVGSYGHEEAERLFRAYLALGDAATPELVDVQNELGEHVLTLRGRMREAETIHRQALEAARRLGAPLAEARALHMLGAVSSETGRPEEARTLFEAAIAISRTHGDDAGVARSLLALASWHQERGNLDEAAARYQESLTLHRRNRDRSGEGVTLGNIATLHAQMGRHDESYALLEQSLAVLVEVGNRTREAVVLGNLANLARDHGRPLEARGLYDRALMVHREVGNRRLEGQALGNLAALCHGQGLLDDAAALYERSIFQAREVGNPRAAAYVQANFASMRIDQGRPVEARALLHQARASAIHTADARLEGIVLSIIPRTYAPATPRERVRTTLNRALERARAAGDRVLEGRILGDLATLELVNANLREAERLGALAITMAQESRDPTCEGNVLGTLVRVALLNGDLDRAEQRAAVAEALLSDLGAKLEVALVLCAHGHVRLARRVSPAAILERVRAINAEIGAPAQGPAAGPLAAALAVLARASAAFESGKPLVAGHRPRDLSRKLRRLASRPRNS